MTGVFFVLAFAITWALQLPAVVSHAPEKYMALVGLGAFGPMFAAMICARFDGGIAALFRPMGLWRVPPGWYVAALGIPGGIFVLGAAAYNAFGHHEPLVYPPASPAFMLAAIVFPIGEEVGWRGYALPRLRARYGALGASVIVGVLWTFWHVPMLTLQGIAPWMYAVFVPFMVCGSVLFTWIYAHTRGSLLLAVLTHVGAHLNNPGHAMPQRYVPMILHTAAYVVFAVVLVALDRKTFRAAPVT